MDLNELLKGNVTIQMKVAPDTKDAEKILETLRDAYMAMAQIADEALCKIKPPAEEKQEMPVHCPTCSVELTLKSDDPVQTVKYCTICGKEWAHNK